MSDDERKIVLLHQPDLHTSNPTMALACLIALMNRKLFIDGTQEVLPFLQDLGSNFAYTKFSFSQNRYLNYFD